MVGAAGGFMDHKGCCRRAVFCSRWRLVVDEARRRKLRADGVELDIDTLQALHRTIVGVSEELLQRCNNTATAKLISA